MIPAWMAYSIIVAGLLGTVAALLERAVRAMGRPTRFLWAAAMGVVLVLTASALWTSGCGCSTDVIPGATSGGAPIASAPAADAAPRGWLSRGALYVKVHSPWAAAMSRTERPLDTLDRTLLIAWAAMSIAAILLLVGSITRLRRRRKAWLRGSIDGTPLLLTDGVGPAVVGIVEPEIAVPRWILRCDPVHQRLVIEHERQHILARDPLMILSGLFMTAALPWNPALWIVVRRLRRAIEIDCDRRVLRAVPSPRTYAELLVDIGSRAVPEAALTAALADTPSDIERRVADILGLDRALNLPSRSLRIVLGSVLLIAACVAPKPFVRLAGAGPAQSSGNGGGQAAVTSLDRGIPASRPQGSKQEVEMTQGPFVPSQDQPPAGQTRSGGGGARRGGTPDDGSSGGAGGAGGRSAGVARRARVADTTTTDDAAVAATLDSTTAQLQALIDSAQGTSPMPSARSGGPPPGSLPRRGGAGGGVPVPGGRSGRGGPALGDTAVVRNRVFDFQTQGIDASGVLDGITVPPSAGGRSGGRGGRVGGAGARGGVPMSPDSLSQLIEQLRQGAPMRARSSVPPDGAAGAPDQTDPTTP